MSFIRCLSNPERLYIIDNIGGWIDIWHGMEPPFASETQKDREWQGSGTEKHLEISRREFYGVCKQWAHHGGNCKYKDFIIDEVTIRTDTGEINPDLDTLEKVDLKAYLAIPKDYRIRLRYKGQFVLLWQVTWAYVVKNAIKNKPWLK